MVVMLLLSACQTYTCPAYQSSFYLTAQEQQKRHSTFGNDSLPQSAFDVKKDHHLVIRSTSRRQKTKMMYTVRMEKVHAPTAADSTSNLRRRDRKPKTE